MTADDVAGLALFLCSPAARNLTGQAISVDAGMIGRKREGWNRTGGSRAEPPTKPAGAHPRAPRTAQREDHRRGLDRFRRLAGEHRLTLGELFEQALDAWETQRGAERRLDVDRRP